MMGFLCILLAITLLALGLVFFIFKKKTDRTLTDNQSHIQSLNNRNAQLEKYESILNLDEEISNRSEKIRQDEIAVEKLIEQRHKECAEQIEKDRAESKQLKADARTLKKEQ